MTQTSVFNTLFSTLLLCFISFYVQAQSYTTPDHFFINCGSPTTVADETNRSFTGDMNSDGSFRFTSRHSDNINKSPPFLNSSVRIFNEAAFYEFKIDHDSVHILRLYFYPSNFLPFSSTALFNVSAHGFFLLKDVTNDSATINEFFVRLKPGKFRINFLPKISYVAYVNAIELFPTPPNFILSGILHTIYRVNMGGSEIASNGDKLWRKWDQDEQFLMNPSFATINYTPSVTHKNRDDDLYFAPDLVYKMAKVVRLNHSFPHNLFNLTRGFLSRNNTHHFIRLHFYDFIAATSNQYLFFNLSIGNSFSKRMNTSNSADVNTPFHLDTMVDSDERGFVDVTVIPLGRNESGEPIAFLNGVEIMELMEEQSKDPFIDSEENTHLGLFIGLAVGGFILLCILGCGIFLGLKWRKQRIDQEASHRQWAPILPTFGGGSTHMSSSHTHTLKLGLKFSVAEIKTATNNFNKKFVIGEGGFGKVYKGVMSNGMKVAVKRSQPGAGQGICEFEREIMTLSRIRHRHLVSFIGFCDERSEMILVYEFMEKGTLREHLYDSKFPPLSWKKRLEVCIGAARGLHYLHKGLVGGIIHRDVKSTNILLDENFVAKVSDFGLSIAGSLDETYVSTDIKGTFGYLDPEYFRTQQLTEKSDIYSFGVLLLEVLCARLVLNPTLPIEQINLAEWGMKCKKMGLLEEIIDPKLEGQIEPNSLRKFSDIIEKCLQDDAAYRPTMADVLWDLEYALQLQQNAHSRMPHEDSETNANRNSSSVIQRIPSMDSTILRDRSDMNQDLDSHLGLV